jgi:prevent-host-death family protein
MKRIGIRELRQDASRHLRAVERGETIEVTDRGRPVARIVPIRASHPLEALQESGRATAATGDLRELGPPLEPRDDRPRPSRVLSDLRSDER